MKVKILYIVTFILAILAGCQSSQVKDGYVRNDAAPCSICHSKPVVTWKCKRSWSSCDWAIGCKTRSCPMAHKQSGFRSEAEAMRWWNKNHPK